MTENKRKKPHLIVTAGIIYKDDKILITQRPSLSHFSGKWEFPGGKKHKYESLEDCLIREIREELNIDIEIEKYLTKIEHEYDKFFIELHIFRCNHVYGTPEPDQMQDWKWISPQELNNFDFTEPDKLAIEKLNLDESITLSKNKD